MSFFEKYTCLSLIHWFNICIELKKEIQKLKLNEREIKATEEEFIRKEENLNNQISNMNETIKSKNFQIEQLKNNDKIPKSSSRVNVTFNDDKINDLTRDHNEKVLKLNDRLFLQSEAVTELNSRITQSNYDYKVLLSENEKLKRSLITAEAKIKSLQDDEVTAKSDFDLQIEELNEELSKYKMNSLNVSTLEADTKP